MTSESVAAFRARAREWLAAHVPRSAPNEPLQLWDDEGVARDRGIAASLWNGGLAGITVPVEYGGLGLTEAHLQAFRQEAAGYRMPEAYSIGLNVVLPTLLAHGTEEIKQRFVPAMLRGEHIWCQLLSEPSSGSDLAGLLTRARHEGQGEGATWRINGSKVWTTGGHYSDWAMCLARTDPEVPKHAGLTVFLFPMDSPGLTVEPIVLLDGSVDFCEERLDDVLAEADLVLGEVNGGWAVMGSMMEAERGAIGRGWAMAAQPGEGGEHGISLDRDLLDPAVRRAGGGELDARTRDLIGERWVLSAVHSLTTQRVTAAVANRELPGAAAALLKAMAAMVELREGEIGLAVAGAGAVAWPSASPAFEGQHRLSSHGIGGGTTEMQRNAIAERLLGLPREPAVDRDVPFSQLRKNTVPTT